MRHLKITYNGKVYEIDVEESGSAAAVSAESAPAAPVAPVHSAAAPAPAEVPAGEGHRVEAPMSGRVVEIVAPVGTAVKAGDTILVIEAMKLESEICTDYDGVVKQILVSPKQDISSNDVLAIVG